MEIIIYIAFCFVVAAVVEFLLYRYVKNIFLKTVLSFVLPLLSLLIYRNDINGPPGDFIDLRGITLYFIVLPVCVGCLAGLLAGFLTYLVQRDQTLQEISATENKEDEHDHPGN